MFVSCGFADRVLVFLFQPRERAEVKRRLERLPCEPDEIDASVDEARQAAIDLDQRIQGALYEAGLVSEIKPPITDPTPYRREPITIKGKPLSETVIEERRWRRGRLFSRYERCGEEIRH